MSQIMNLQPADTQDTLQTVALGIDSFNTFKEKNFFYVDKTGFIREWWEAGDKVTVITRPRRFGKTLTMSMLEHFFSIAYAGQSSLFDGFEIWRDEKYRELQGTLPVIFVSFARVKDSTFSSAMNTICFIFEQLFRKHSSLVMSPNLPVDFKDSLQKLKLGLEEKQVSDAKNFLSLLSEAMTVDSGKKAIILIDEYDAPLQEAWMHGYWKEMSEFMRSLFNSTFKDNPFLERGLLTGVTRVSKESMFSDLNNLRTVSILTDGYETSFGFTEEEVFSALERYGLSNRKDEVREMYDGFVFGSKEGLYNPWSIINYLKSGGKLDLWWANTSTNDLAVELLREGSPESKAVFQELIGEGSVRTFIDERIVFTLLEKDPDAIWGLLLECGYLKPLRKDGEEYELVATNKEVRLMFARMVDRWFPIKWLVRRKDFLKALKDGNLVRMNEILSDLVDISVSTFDSGKHSGDHQQPERFFHGVILGLIAPLHDKYHIDANSPQGDGRCDIILTPRDSKRCDGIIMEFTLCGKGRSLESVANQAYSQIEKMQYDMGLRKRTGLPPERIHKYGFAFHAKKVIIRGH